MQKNSKVLFLINKLKTGGAENVFIRDVNTLDKKGLSGYMVMVFGNRDDQDFSMLAKLELSEKKIFYVGARSLFDIKSFFSLIKFIKNNKISIVFSTLNEANIWCRFLKLFLPKLRTFIREANVAGPKPFLFKFLDIIFNIFVEKIICVSEEVKDSLLKYQPFYKHKMIVLMNGVEIPETPKEYSKNIELPLKILNIGSLTPKKGQKFLIKACYLVNKKQQGSIKLKILGDGPEKENLSKIIKELNLEGLAELVGLVTPQKVSEQYLATDVFVLSSLWEGCPNVLLEAMAYGLASISTMVSGAKDIVEDGKSGKLIPPNDAEKLSEAIIYMLENKEKLKYFGKEAREKIIKNFSIENHVDKLISILK